MRQRISDAAVWLRKRWLLVSLVGMILVALLAATPAVLRLPHYPADRATSLRQNIEIANLSPKERVALEKDLLLYETDNTVKIWTAIVQAFGGAALLIGLLFTWRNLRVTQLKLDLDREAQLTNRFSQATTQLGAELSDGKPNIEARLGGIYALSWIARDSPSDYWPVMEILTAYVRHNAPWAQSGHDAACPRETPHPPKPRTDIQAILTILGRAQPPKEPDVRRDRKFDLRFTDLRGAEFWDARLEKTDFWGAHLEGAKLWGAYLNEAKFENANLQDSILREAKLSGADLKDACLVRADLAGADLRNAIHLTPEQVHSALEGGRGALLSSAFAGRGVVGAQP